IAQRLLVAAWQQGSWRAHHTSGTSLKYIPRRAVLYVPGNDERKLRKLTSLNVDCAVLDCEDGVALNKKVPSAVIIPASPDSLAHENQIFYRPQHLHSARC
ncbi:citramalyl-CoA lyase, mitochondrial, partial [Tachysurus ichikawai]